MPASNSNTSRLKRGLTTALLAPLWLAQVLYVTKSFERNPILGNRLLNRLGLHVARLLLAHGVTRLRWLLLMPLLPAAQRRRFRQQGYLLLPDFLPAAQFQALATEVRGWQGEVRECVQGDTQTHRTLLHRDALQQLPACRRLLAHRGYLNALQWAAIRYGRPLIFIEQVRNGFAAAGRDPQKQLHADTFHPTMKSWLFIDAVTLERGPFSYVPGSNRLTWQRLAWEYRQSVAGRDLPDPYARRGSLRLTEPERQALGLPPAQAMAVPPNTLLIADTFGFHARSPAAPGSTRLAIYASSRTNPFNPWPGLNLPALNDLRYQALRWLYRHQDRRAERRGTRSPWHRVTTPAARPPEGPH